MSDKIKCSKTEFYAICTIAWDQCEEHLDDFYKYNSIYTDKFIEEIRLGFTQLKSVPDDSIKYSDHEKHKTSLEQKLAYGIDLWEKLRKFIIKAYPDETRNRMLSEAGLGFLDGAKTIEFDACKDLLDAGIRFIMRETAKLMSEDKMKGHFIREYEINFNNYIIFYNTYLESNLNLLLKGNKNSEIKQVLRNLTKMLNDAQEIYHDKPEIQKIFHLEIISDKVLGNSVSIKGVVISANIRHLGKINALIIIPEINMRTRTDKDNIFLFHNIPPGKYRIQVIAYGFKNLYENVEIKDGNTKNINLLLFEE